MWVRRLIAAWYWRFNCAALDERHKALVVAVVPQVPNRERLTAISFQLRKVFNGEYAGLEPLPMAVYRLDGVAVFNLLGTASLAPPDEFPLAVKISGPEGSHE